MIRGALILAVGLSAACDDRRHLERARHATSGAEQVSATTEAEAGTPAAIQPEMWMIRGVQQSMLLRVQPSAEAILLWVHGGPGSTMMPWTEAFDWPLLNRFTLVHWDQRGAGQSYSPEIPPDTINLENLALDGIEVIQRLRERFPGHRIVMAAHSWGTILAREIIRRDPTSVQSLVLVGTVVDVSRAEELQFDFLRAQFRAQTSTIEQLEQISSRPLETHEQLLEVNQFLMQAGGVFGSLEMSSLESYQRESHVYSEQDWENQHRGAMVSLERLWPVILSYRASEHAAIAVPVAFIQGAHDMVTPTNLVREYFERVEAPMGKVWIQLEGRAHFPMWESPSEFAQALQDGLRELDERNDIPQ